MGADGDIGGAAGVTPASVEVGAWRALGRSARHPVRFVVAFTRRIAQDDIMTPAAAMAYYFFFALFPLVLFVLAVASLFSAQGLPEWLLANLADYLPQQAFTLLQGIVQGLLGTPRSGLVSLGAALTLWTASSAFGAVITGLNRAYRVRELRPWWRLRLEAIGLTLALSLLMVIAFVLGPFGGQLVTAVTGMLGPLAGAVARVVRWVASLASVMIVVAAVYTVCPAVPHQWRWIRPGSVLFTFGFAGSSAVFSYYVAHVASYDKTYGSLGAVIVLLFWMYLLALFLLLGGELNAYLEELARVDDSTAS
jgi:membrane protein